jgi:heme-degrading monooxygenase HmoA
MNARLSRWAGLDAERLNETVQQFEQQFLPALEQMSGFGGCVVMLDQKAGKAAAMTFWETDQDMRASDKLADEARAAAEAQQSGPVREPIIDHYEVVLRR